MPRFVLTIAKLAAKKYVQMRLPVNAKNSSFNIKIIYLSNINLASDQPRNKFGFTNITRIAVDGLMHSPVNRQKIGAT